ncbi:hypothetical protein C6P45_003820 [Maudiozyma exigua]|uniref:Uncharacterized protein n=1 Tax=Maudiozyma exigua TaxID=34358 RepID=A0A9P7BC79_MAUEX|nr:hypothetical protein C6P45_003820 [Kazachstania exigua]
MDNSKMNFVKEFPEVKQLLQHFLDLQEEYNMEFSTIGTTPETLKIYCNSVGIESNDDTIPFYLIQYNNDKNSFQLWSNGSTWDNVKIFAKLYESFTSATIKKFSHWEKYLLTHENYINSPFRDTMRLSLNKLNIPWKQIDIKIFWDQLHGILTDLNGKKDIDDINILKTLITLTILRCNVIKNEYNLAKDIMQFCHMIEIKRIELSDKISSGTDSELDILQRESSHESVSNMSGSISSVDSENSNGMYTYGKVPIMLKRNSIPFLEPESSANQVVDNFNSHFKLMAEDYELFELKTKFNRRRSTTSTSRRRNKSKKEKISKIRENNRSRI